MSVELTPSDSLARPTTRPVGEIARDIQVDPRIEQFFAGAPFFQAGLAGYSDGAMRLVARRHGCPFCVTEALLDQTLISGGKGQAKENPDLLAERAGCNGGTALRAVNVFPALRAGEGTDSKSRQNGDSSESCPTNAADDWNCDPLSALTQSGSVESGPTLEDHPIAGQIMGTEPGMMAKAAAMLAGMGYETIDVNFACPVKKIKRRSRGGHFLTAPRDAIEVLRAVREAVPAHIPTTVKLRRAWDDTDEMARNFELIFNAAYEIGYAWTTVHCRTVVQKYHGPSKWPFLTDLVKRHPDKLIFGSGDIWEAGDIFRMIDATGVHAVSVARGCIGNPWIFKQARLLMAGVPEEEALAPPTIAEQRAALARTLRALHGSPRRAAAPHA
jgi:tRNA-dihydrouridine synthase